MSYEVINNMYFIFIVKFYIVNCFDLSKINILRSIKKCVYKKKHIPKKLLFISKWNARIKIIQMKLKIIIIIIIKLITEFSFEV